MAATINALTGLDDLLVRCEAFIARMHELGTEPGDRKILRRLYTPGEAAKLVGRTRMTLTSAEGMLGELIPQRNPATNRRVGYTLEQVQAFRAHFKTLPWRDPTDPALVIPCQNFKGGTGKSATCVNLSNYLGEKGYRVLVIDTDSQATTTSFFGYMPDRDLTRDDTILPYIAGEQTTLEYAIRKTHWPTVDLIPACLGLGDLDIEGVLLLQKKPDPEERREFFRELRYGIRSVSSRYDVILVDTPPALGVTSLMVLMAADSIVIPTTAQMADFASTTQFCRMVRNYIEKIDPEKSYFWIQVLITRFSRRGKQSRDDKALQEQFVEAMQGIFGESRFRHVVHEAAELQSAAATFTTPYEQTKPNRRVLKQMGHVFEEIETAIQRCWPSKTDVLTERGIA